MIRLGSLLLVAAAACGGTSSAPPPVEPVEAPGPASAAPPDPAPAEQTEADRAALIAAGEAYARESHPEMDLEVQFHAIEGDFALLLVIPSDEELESALLFMKREGGTWRGVHLSTALVCEALTAEGAPESLCERL
ncbi:MAG TPA: hypothetical protein VKZ63_16440 [Kofleriaceae bacterium]|nr:hypothetical protein [Kofleriaceae bacterium]